MKKFKTPTMKIINLDPEDLMRTSGDCMVEAQACLKCYCSGVTCDGTYTCDGFVCPRYDDL